MTQLPTSLSDTAKQYGQQRQAFADFLAAVKEMPGGLDETTLQIATGVITPTRAMHRVQAESGGVDSLTDIIGTNHPGGRYLILRPLGTDQITIVHDLAKIDLHYDANYVMNNADMGILLGKSGGGNLWIELLRFGRDTIQTGDGTPGVAFSGNWAGTTFPLEWFKDQNGVVHISGRAANSTDPDSSPTILPLPAGYRPTNLLRVAVIDADVGVQEVQFQPGGNVVFSRLVGTTDQAVTLHINTSYRAGN